MKSYPRAKINIGLNIINKRADGYHDLESLFIAIPFQDELEIEQSTDGFRLDQMGISVTINPEDNLVTKAYRLLSEYVGGLPSVNIKLKKNIPSGAGLGGGSADASSTLLMLRELFSLPIEDQTLKELACRLGADCPFFINPTPHLATGIGDQLSPFDIDLHGVHLYLTLPDIHVSTAEAYSGVRPLQPQYDLVESLGLPMEMWQERIVNNFEPHIFKKYPLLENIKEAFYSLGATYSAMSGSGSTIYALSQQPLNEQELSHKLPYPTIHFQL